MCRPCEGSPSGRPSSYDEPREEEGRETRAWDVCVLDICGIDFRVGREGSCERFKCLRMTVVTDEEKTQNTNDLLSWYTNDLIDGSF